MLEFRRTNKQPKWNTMHNIVEFVKYKPLCDIGQLDKTTMKLLNKAVKDGILEKGKGGPYPKLKTIYAVKGFDFSADRQNHINMAMFVASAESYARI